MFASSADLRRYLFGGPCGVVLYWIGLHIFGKAANLEVCSDFVEADHRLHMESTKHLSTFSEYG